MDTSQDPTASVRSDAAFQKAMQSLPYIKNEIVPVGDRNAIDLIALRWQIQRLDDVQWKLSGSQTVLNTIVGDPFTVFQRALKDQIDAARERLDTLYENASMENPVLTQWASTGSIVSISGLENRVTRQAYGTDKKIQYDKEILVLSHRRGKEDDEIAIEARKALEGTETFVVIDQGSIGYSNFELYENSSWVIAAPCDEDGNLLEQGHPTIKVCVRGKYATNILVLGHCEIEK